VTTRELRYRLTAAFLQSDGPLTIGELAAQCGGDATELGVVLETLVSEGLVAAGELIAEKPAPQYCWAARWAQVTERRAAAAEQELQAVVGAFPRELAIDSDPVLAFNHFVVNEYKPPRDKRLLVFFQCSVRRPFSKSPSHASMRRAVAAATGRDPAKEFKSCPVHVVVLASNIGPVPYELEDVYPANVGGGGVKHFGDEHYARVKPVLAERMADYITSHRAGYDRVATFTHDRYGEVMAAARELAGLDFPIFPTSDGPRIVRMGRSRPRTYWAKCWIQLYLEVVSWLDPAAQQQAQARLEKLDVAFE